MTHLTGSVDPFSRSQALYLHKCGWRVLSLRKEKKELNERDYATRIYERPALLPLALTPITLPQSSSQPDNRYDVVVAGAGHNSLAAACYLAKAGFRVVVLEGRPMIGGATKTAELTLTGFHSDVCSCDHNTIQSNPMLKDEELHLKDYGLDTSTPIRPITCPSRMAAA